MSKYWVTRIDGETCVVSGSPLATETISKHYYSETAIKEAARLNMKHEQEQCEHESGERYRMYDGDGCGYVIWRCDACGYEEIDTMP